MVYHYTTVDTLAQILKNGAIRFSRLDLVDDIEESTSCELINMSKYLFISCWTDNAIESIPQWNMYSKDMTGVRIGIEEDIFDKYQVGPLPPGVKQTGKIDFILPWSEIFTDKYIVLSALMGKKIVRRKIEYNENVSNYSKDSIVITRHADGRAEINIKDFSKLAGCKNMYWKFQDEYRYVLFIVPSKPEFAVGAFDISFSDSFPSYLVYCLLNGIEMPIKHYDLPIKKSILESIEITLGPLCNDGHKLIVQNLVKQFTKNGIVKESILKGKIRKVIK